MDPNFLGLKNASSKKYPSLAEGASLFYDLAVLKNETGYHIRLCTNGCLQIYWFNKGIDLTNPKTKVPPHSPGIGLLQETSLHAALKTWLALPGDRFEAPVDGYVIDILREGLLIEIQTGNFSALKTKLPRLVQSYPVRLVYPIAQEKWILRLAPDGEKALSRRKSPRKGALEHLFLELVRIPELILHPNFSLEVLLTREEEIWRDDGRGSWRRKGWSIADRRLVSVVRSTVLEDPQDFRRLLPHSLPRPFTTRELAAEIRQPAYLAGKMVYCLRKMGVLHAAGKRGRAWLYIETGADSKPERSSI
jgi:hypothetical protein